MSAARTVLSVRGLLGLAAVVCAVGVLLAPAVAAETVTVYSSLPLKTPEGAIYQDIVLGERLALEQAGGQAGPHTVRFVSLNDARDWGWDSELILRNAWRAAQDESAMAYLGEFNSGASTESMPLLNQAGILQISPTNTYTGLTRREGRGYGYEPDAYYPTGDRTYGRVAPADHLQADALAALAGQLGLARVFLVDDGEVYGAGLGKMLARRLKVRGIRVVGHARLRSRGPALRRLLRRIGRSEARAMMFTGFKAAGTVKLWRSVHRRHPALELIGPDGIADGVFGRRLISSGSRAERRIGRRAVARTWITLYTRPREAWPAAGQAFYDAFAARYGRQPGEYAIFGYEAMQVALSCIAPASGFLKGDVVDNFFAIRDRDSVLGRYSIDRHGDSTLSTYGVWRLSQETGELVYDRTVDSAAG